MSPASAETVRYLQRLGVAAPREPSIEALRRLHAAHVERIAYEALDVQRGLTTSIALHDSVARIAVGGRGGYCYHLNGAFGVLLGALGFEVVRHRAGVQNHSDGAAPGSARANHLALTVHGLPTAACPSGDWLVDVGLADALHEPLPLHEGTYTQGPFRFGLRPSEVDPGGWRLDHDRAGSFAGMDFAPAAATIDDFLARHRELETSPTSGFVRTPAVYRRDAAGVDSLIGCLLRRVDGAGQRSREIGTEKEWFEVLAAVFLLPLGDLGPADRAVLFRRVRAAHDAWRASKLGG
jgi:N-hydroxyarylamine O-acetyltransferase